MNFNLESNGPIWYYPWCILSNLVENISSYIHSNLYHKGKQSQETRFAYSEKNPAWWKPNSTFLALWVDICIFYEHLNHHLTHSTSACDICPDSKVHVARMGPTWVLSAQGGPHAGPMNLANRVGFYHLFLITMYTP